MRKEKRGANEAVNRHNMNSALQCIDIHVLVFVGKAEGCVTTKMAVEYGGIFVGCEDWVTRRIVVEYAGIPLGCVWSLSMSKTSTLYSQVISNAHRPRAVLETVSLMIVHKGGDKLPQVSLMPHPQALELRTKWHCTGKLFSLLLLSASSVTFVTSYVSV